MTRTLLGCNPLVVGKSGMSVTAGVSRLCQAPRTYLAGQVVRTSKTLQVAEAWKCAYRAEGKVVRLRRREQPRKFLLLRVETPGREIGGAGLDLTQEEQAAKQCEV